MSSKHRPQNQHFIPRFILRQFAPTTQPPAAPIALTGKNGKKDKRADYLINKLDLQQSKLTQRPVSIEYSLPDMYRDPGLEENPNHLEKKLAHLEGQASNILQRTQRELPRHSTEPVFKLKRHEKNILRKFLFLMKYRNKGFFDRYNHDHIDTYDSDDRDTMREYMKAKGLTQPRDVWFDNLRGILNLDMDAGSSWTQRIQQEIYPDDAKWFILHLTSNYVAFCQPEQSDQEFILTENSCSVFEGPSNPGLRLESGNITPGIYTEWHNFAPVTPRLLIVLRSVFLPPLVGELPEAVRDLFQSIHSAARARHLYPDAAGSMLQDMPIQKCEVEYMNARDSNFQAHKDDNFIFRCIKLSPIHVSKINNIFLEEAYCTSSIIYHSEPMFKRSIEHYLRDMTPGMKQLIPHPLDKREPYLMTLRKIVRDLGGNGKCHFKPAPRIDVQMSEHVAKEVGIQLLQRQDGILPPVYQLLKQPDLESSGMNASNIEHVHQELTFDLSFIAPSQIFWYDVLQAGLIMQMRMKTDKIIYHQSALTSIEQSLVTLHRRELITSLAPERVWLYMKVSRNMDKFDTNDFTIQIADLELEGVEDKFAKCELLYDSSFACIY